jgi:hypothetical protein
VRAYSDEKWQKSLLCKTKKEERIPVNTGRNMECLKAVAVRKGENQKGHTKTQKKGVYLIANPHGVTELMSSILKKKTKQVEEMRVRDSSNT